MFFFLLCADVCKYLIPKHVWVRFLGNNSLSGSLPAMKSPLLSNLYVHIFLVCSHIVSMIKICIDLILKYPMLLFRDFSYNHLSGNFPSWTAQKDLQLYVSWLETSVYTSLRLNIQITKTEKSKSDIWCAFSKEFGGKWLCDWWHWYEVLASCYHFFFLLRPLAPLGKTLYSFQLVSCK